MFFKKIVKTVRFDYEHRKGADNLFQNGTTLTEKALKQYTLLQVQSNQQA